MECGKAGRTARIDKRRRDRSKAGIMTAKTYRSDMDKELRLFRYIRRYYCGHSWNKTWLDDCAVAMLDGYKAALLRLVFALRDMKRAV